jgi:membrane associated rhomboid family serine protease
MRAESPEAPVVIFVPVSDDNPLRFIPYQWVTVGLIAVNVLVYLVQLAGIGASAEGSFGVVPVELLQVGIFGGSAFGRYDTVGLPEGATLLTYSFFHADFLHLASNMLFLWVFGDNIEDAVGHVRFLVFYLACGAVAGLVHAWMLPNAWVPLIGASGAVAGVIAAYLVLHPHVRVWVLAFRVIPLRITALWVLGAWVGTQVFMVLFSRGDQVAWWAHIGGMLAGATLIVVFRRPGVPLRERDRTGPARESASIFGHAVPAGPSELPWETPRSLYEALRLPLTEMPRFVNEQGAAMPGGAVVNGKTCDILRYEARGDDFALVRIQADGSRSELILTAANVVHLGMLAPGFSRRLLANKVAGKSGAIGASIKNRMAGTSVRTIETLVRILEREGGAARAALTEQRARRLASRLLARADALARDAGLRAKNEAPATSADERP